MRERARSVDGALSIEPMQPRGTRVLARLPMAWDAQSVQPPAPSG
jgi:nitrate/nitrite-specific signal transduction histidine kinase